MLGSVEPCAPCGPPLCSQLVRGAGGLVRAVFVQGVCSGGTHVGWVCSGGRSCRRLCLGGICVQGELVRAAHSLPSACHPREPREPTPYQEHSVSSEFMVEEHELRKEKIQEDYNDKYWDQRYTVVQRQIPSFLQKMAGKILSTGDTAGQGWAWCTQQALNPRPHLPGHVGMPPLSCAWSSRPSPGAGIPLCTQQVLRRRSPSFAWAVSVCFPCALLGFALFPDLGGVSHVHFLPLYCFVSRTLLPLKQKLFLYTTLTPEVWVFHTKSQFSVDTSWLSYKLTQS